MSALSVKFFGVLRSLLLDALHARVNILVRMVFVRMVVWLLNSLGHTVSS